MASMEVELPPVGLDAAEPVDFADVPPPTGANAPNYFTCRQCQKIFWSDSSLKHHCSLYHSEKAFVCEICGKAFRFRSNLAEHRSVHTSLKPYVCKFCGKSSRLKGNLTKHILKHHKKEQNAYIGKDDIIIKKGKKSVKDPAAVDFLEKSMIVLSPDNNQFHHSGSSAALQLLTMAQLASPPAAVSPRSLCGADRDLLSIDDSASEQTLFTEDSSSIHVVEPESVDDKDDLQLHHSTTSSISTPSNASVAAAASPVQRLPNTQCHLCGKHFRKDCGLQVHLTVKHRLPPPDTLDDADSPAEAVASDGAIGVATPPPMKAGNHYALSNGYSAVAAAAPIDSLLLGADLREMRRLLHEFRQLQFGGGAKVEALLAGLEQRVARIEKQVETTANSIYTLVQLQSAMNAAFTRFRVDTCEQLAALKGLVHSAMPAVYEAQRAKQ